jgi:hypothetical protein
LWWTKWHWDRFSPSTSVSPVNSHSTDCSATIIIIIIIIPQHSKTRNAARDTHKSAPNIRKKWQRCGKKYKKIITGHGEKKILKKCAVK